MLGTDESAASVRRVHMQPNRLALTHHTQLIDVVKRTDGSRAERTAHLQPDNIKALAMAILSRSISIIFETNLLYITDKTSQVPVCVEFLPKRKVEDLIPMLSAIEELDLDKGGYTPWCHCTFCFFGERPRNTVQVS